MSTPEHPAGHDERGGEGNEYAAYEKAMQEHVESGLADGSDRTGDRLDTVPGADDTRGYDPTGDTGFVDARREDVDRTTGHRDSDYDTGRVDTAHADAGPGSARAVDGTGRGTSGT